MGGRENPIGPKTFDRVHRLLPRAPWSHFALPQSPGSLKTVLRGGSARFFGAQIYRVRAHLHGLRLQPRIHGSVIRPAHRDMQRGRHRHRAVAAQQDDGFIAERLAAAARYLTPWKHRSNFPIGESLPSLPPDKSRLPSGANATHQTDAVWPMQRRRSRLASTSTMRTLLSAAAIAAKRPSRLNAMALAGLLCASSGSTSPVLSASVWPNDPGWIGLPKRSSRTTSALAPGRTSACT